MVRRVSRRNYRSKRVRRRGSRSLRKRVKSRRTRSLRSRRSLRRRRMRGGAKFKEGDTVYPLMSGDMVGGLRKGDDCTIITVYNRYKQDGTYYQPYDVKNNNTDEVYKVNEEFLSLTEPSVIARALMTRNSIRDDPSTYTTPSPFVHTGI